MNKLMSANSRVLASGDNQITQKYIKGTHNGIDIVKYKSQLDNIIAHSDGVVVLVQTGHKNNTLASGMNAYGNCVKIDHKNGYHTLYAHLSNVNVKNGEEVKKGQPIGYMGNTGRSFGGHLHFEVFKENTKIDPTPYINSELPNSTSLPHIYYRSYNNKWHSEVVDYNNINSNGYAGVQGKSLTALIAKSTVGNLRYRAHLVGHPSNQWLGWVSGYNINDYKNGYAGIKGKEIDAVQMLLEGTNDYVVKYRVSPKKSKTWYGWCNNLNNESKDGYAGIMGVPIDCIQIYIDKK